MLFFFLLLHIAGALLAPVLFKGLKRYTGILLSFIPASFFVWAVTNFTTIQEGKVISNTLPFIRQLGIGLNFSLDGLSLIFLLIITFIGSLILIYAVPYFHGSKELARFLPILIFFTAAMLGLVLADDLISLFICWELTSISSYLLIGFEHEEKEARESAWKALVITATGGLGLLAGFLLLANISGTFSISEIIHSSELTGDPLFIPALVLILFGAFTKSAQYPFHSWLPSAMTAPTPVSAYLHSATMVQAGVYLLFRIYPLFHESSSWSWILMGFGGVSMVLAGLKAVGQRDLKKILAYATISALGLIIFLIGLGSKKALEAAIIFMILHAAYKGGLFLVAGIIDKKVHSRDIRKLSGLFRFMPLTAVAALLLAASNAGLPPFLGYIGKELIYKSTVESQEAILYTLGAFLANTGIVATAFMVGLKPFTGKKPPIEEKLHISPDFYLPPLILGIAGLATGVLPAFTTKFLLDPPLKTLTDSATHEPLKLWHGFTTPLFVSAFTILAGVLAYFFRDFFLKADKGIISIKPLNTNYLYEKAFSGLFSFAEKQTRWFQHGYLRWYLFTAITFLLLLSFPAVFRIPLRLNFSTGNHFYIYAIAALTVISGIISIRSKTFLMSLAALGGVGFSIALLFALLGAPDLAITQFSVETLTVILFVFVVYRLPELSLFSKKAIVALDVLLSVAAGALVTILILLVNEVPEQADVSQFFLENSYTRAHGRNIVNVILTDFRAMDTLGETIVLATAGLGVYILLKSRAPKNDKL